MVTTTTQYSFQKPTVGDDEDAWGGYLNSNFDQRFPDQSRRERPTTSCC